MARQIFVTGTDTEVGKTLVSRALMQALTAGNQRVAGFHPFSLPHDELSRGSQATDYATLSRGLQAQAAQADCVVVDGSGGWRSLMDDRRSLSGWVVEEQLPVVLVVGIKPGCISHALLTAQAIIHDGLPLLGWVANRINPGLAHYAQVLAVLAEMIPAPMLGELPYLPRAESRELGHYIDLSRLDLAS